MQQVLFRIQIFDWVDLPIFGYGMMLFLAYFFCTWMASWLAKKEGIPPQLIYDLGIWIFVGGILGARITFMMQYHVPIQDIYKIWDGGLVFYGSAIGGLAGYFAAWLFMLRKHHISTLKMADIIAPCGALGLCLGRVGCLLNGCCFGNVACEDCPAIHFPLSAPPRFMLVHEGYQTAAGFTTAEMNGNRVVRVEPGSPAQRAGLEDGDLILEIDGQKNVFADSYLGTDTSERRGKNSLTLKVKDKDGLEKIVGPFVPWTIGLHPTQLYETISMGLLFVLLLAYYPFRRHPGQVMVLFMVCYAIHRFLNETLRNDTKPVLFDMTLSQNISIVVLLSGLVLGLVLWVRARRRTGPLPLLGGGSGAEINRPPGGTP